VVAQIVVEAAGRAGVLRISARYEEVAPMTDKISRRAVPPLDAPDRFAGGEVVAAARCPVDVFHLSPAACDLGQARWRAPDVLSP
jgi:hypothetical protein